MTEPVGDPVVDPNPDPAGDPAPPAPDFRPVTSQDEFDRRIQDRLARERSKYSDYEELKAKATKLAEIEAESMSELERERAARTAAEERATRVEAEAKEIRLQSAILAEAAKPERRVVDPDLVATLLAPTLEFDDNGAPTNVAKAMDSLLEARPYLVATDGGTRGNADQGARTVGGVKQVTEAELKNMRPEEINKARKEGRLGDLLGVR